MRAQLRRARFGPEWRPAPPWLAHNLPPRDLQKVERYLREERRYLAALEER